MDQLAEHVVAQQMADGGWNCRATPGSGKATHGSFHTTISALEALLEYERLRPATAQKAQMRGREFLLTHRLFRSYRTGRVVKAEMTRFSFPPLRPAAGAGLLPGARSDPRLEDALRLLEQRRGADGRRLLQNEYGGRMFFRLESVARPSRWNTAAKFGELNCSQPTVLRIA